MPQIENSMLCISDKEFDKLLYEETEEDAEELAVKHADITLDSVLLALSKPRRDLSACH